MNDKKEFYSLKGIKSSILKLMIILPFSLLHHYFPVQTTFVFMSIILFIVVNIMDEVIKIEVRTDHMFEPTIRSNLILERVYLQDKKE